LVDGGFVGLKSLEYPAWLCWAGGDVQAPCWSGVYVMADAQFTAFIIPIVAWVVDHVWHLLFSLWAVLVLVTLIEIRDSIDGKGK